MRRALARAARAIDGERRARGVAIDARARATTTTRTRTRDDGDGGRARARALATTPSREDDGRRGEIAIDRTGLRRALEGRARAGDAREEGRAAGCWDTWSAR